MTNDLEPRPTPERTLVERLRSCGDQYDPAATIYKGNHVRLGTTAPDDISVHREEIYERIKKEREEEGK